MLEVMKKFAVSARRADMDEVCVKMAEHAMKDDWPTVVDVSTFWIEDKGDHFLFAVGTIPDQKEITP